MSDKNVSSENTCFQKYVKECWELIIRYYKEQDYTTSPSIGPINYNFDTRSSCSILLLLETNGINDDGFNNDDFYYFCKHSYEADYNSKEIINLDKFVDNYYIKLSALSDVEIVRVAHFIHLLNENISELSNIYNNFDLHYYDGIFTYGELYPCSELNSYYKSIKDNHIIPVSQENIYSCYKLLCNRCNNPIYLASISFSELFDFIDYNNTNDFTIYSEWVDLPLNKIYANSMPSKTYGNYELDYVYF